jgi:hypothetical protein
MAVGCRKKAVDCRGIGCRKKKEGCRKKEEAVGCRL